MTEAMCMAGALVTLPLPRRSERPLDGFWVRGRRRSRLLAVFVHGMHSNFYRSGFKKALMAESARRGPDLLLFNNRGCEENTATERFRDSLDDLDAALAWARGQGYRAVVLIGHSTGCQKIAYHHLLRRRRMVRGLVFAAVGDDLAIARRTLGRRYEHWIRRARAWVSQGRGDRRLPASCQSFSARRFLSVADPRQPEADLFNFEGRLRRIARLRGPLLAVFPEHEQYACLAVPEMARRLRAAQPRCAIAVVPRADHSFRGAEAAAARVVLDWARRRAP